MIEGTVRPEPRNRPRGDALAKRLLVSQQAVQAVLIVLGIALVTFVLYLYVLPNSQIDAAEMRIVELQAQKAALERQNATLLQEIVRDSDMKTLEIRARQLGMGPTTSAIYLQLPGQESAQASGSIDAMVVAAERARTGELGRPAWLQARYWQDLMRDVRLRVSQAVETFIQRVGAQ